ncbi:glycosyl hydrolase family 31 [Fusarium mundagurra]|uniref:Glycosyl hydrolase family 31 n=1 Tax=Fusarium mundagurra TaxID=1567541 RepID=A0A8H5Y9F8_9HYPO|nr:glycosyl hydrolase family 31 [Fusarium mundagurra]
MRPSTLHIIYAGRDDATNYVTNNRNLFLVDVILWTRQFFILKIRWNYTHVMKPAQKQFGALEKEAGWILVSQLKDLYKSDEQGLVTAGVDGGRAPLHPDIEKCCKDLYKALRPTPRVLVGLRLEIREQKRRARLYVVSGKSLDMGKLARVASGMGVASFRDLFGPDNLGASCSSQTRHNHATQEVQSNGNDAQHRMDLHVLMVTAESVELDAAGVNLFGTMYVVSGLGFVEEQSGTIRFDERPSYTLLAGVSVNGFKKCHQSGFCKRHRQYAGRVSVLGPNGSRHTTSSQAPIPSKDGQLSAVILKSISDHTEPINPPITISFIVSGTEPLAPRSINRQRGTFVRSQEGKKDNILLRVGAVISTKVNIPPSTDTSMHVLSQS